MTTIYIQNKPLFLVEEIGPETEEYLHRPTTILIDDDLHPPAIRTMLYELEQPDYYAGIFKHKNEAELLNAFKSYLTLVMAAGGLVHTNTREVLLIFRRGKWDLPKGKVDEGEDLQSCALREIEEETGVRNLRIEKPLPVTYHTYHENGKHILKETHWYFIQTNDQQEFQPQTEEDIEQCRWVPVDQLPEYIDHTYASVAEVIRAAIKEFKKSS